MKQRFYFDTSVFGGVYDIEFDEPTIQLFEKVKLGEIICIYSDLTIGELDNAPHKCEGLFCNIADRTVRICSYDRRKPFIGEAVYN